MSTLYTKLLDTARCGSVFVWCILFACISHPLHGADFSITPAISIQEVFTDNVTLRPSQFKEEDFITEVTPAITMGLETARSNTQLDYSLQNLLYANDSDRNDLFHLLQVNTTGELLSDRVFLDFSLNRSTQNVGNSGNTAVDNFSISGDRANVLTYKITPSWQQRIGKLAEFTASYSRDDVSSSRLQGSSADDVKVALSSGTAFNQLLWDVKFHSRFVTNDTGRTTRVRNILAKSRYLLSRKLAIFAEAGYDNNRFASNSGDVGGFRWKLGGEWNISQRTGIEAGYGRRFFGDDLLLRIFTRTKRGRITLAYSKKPSTTRALLFEQQVFNFTDQFGDPVLDPVSERVADINVNVPVQTDELLIRSRLKTDIGYRLRKHSLGFSGIYEEVDYQLTRDTEFTRRADAYWTWSFFPNTRSTLTIGWSKQNLRIGNDDRYISAQLRVSHNLREDLIGSIGTRYIDRDSNLDFRKFKEFRLFANLNKEF